MQLSYPQQLLFLFATFQVEYVEPKEHLILSLILCIQQNFLVFIQKKKYLSKKEKREKEEGMKVFDDVHTLNRDFIGKVAKVEHFYFDYHTPKSLFTSVHHNFS